MKFILLTLALVYVCNAQSDDDWLRFQIKYGKLYRSADEATSRRAVWEQNWKLINKHNEEYAKGMHTYTVGENEFADMSFDEFSQKYLGLDSSIVKSIEESKEQHVMTRDQPDKIDLRTLNIVPDIKNQGSCGSCWAFGAIGTVEGAWAREKSVPIPNLSEQQLVDCSKGLSAGYQSNKGCQGGWLEPTYDDIIRDGLQSASSYPYNGKDGVCRYDKSKVVVTISGYKSVNSEAKLVNAIGENNLVNVAMYASSNFQFYRGGIYNSTNVEDKSQVNHAVIAIGYDLTATTPYILYKNSWGTGWGEKGFFRVVHGKTALSIGKYGVYPVV